MFEAGICSSWLIWLQNKLFLSAYCRVGWTPPIPIEVLLSKHFYLDASLLTRRETPLALRHGCKKWVSMALESDKEESFGS